MKRYVILFTLSAFVLIGCSPKIAGIHVGKGKEKEVLTPTIIELKGESFFDKLSDDDNTNE